MPWASSFERNIVNSQGGIEDEILLQQPGAGR